MHARSNVIPPSISTRPGGYRRGFWGSHEVDKIWYVLHISHCAIITSKIFGFRQSFFTHIKHFLELSISASVIFSSGINPLNGCNINWRIINLIGPPNWWVSIITDSFEATRPQQIGSSFPVLACQVLANGPWFCK